MIFKKPICINEHSSLYVEQGVKFYLSDQLSQYYDRGYLSLIAQGHIESNQMKQLAATYCLPHQLATVHYDFAYELLYRPNGTKDEHFLSYEFGQLHVNKQNNEVGSSLERLNLQKYKEHTVYINQELVPITTLLVKELWSSVESLKYVNQLTALDHQYLKNIMSDHNISAYHPDILKTIDENLISLKRGFSVDFYANGHFYTDLVQYHPNLINEIREAARTGVYISQEGNIHHIAERSKFSDFNIVLNFAQEVFRFDKSGSISSKNETILNRLQTALEQGYAPFIENIKHDYLWRKFASRHLVIFNITN